MHQNLPVIQRLMLLHDPIVIIQRNKIQRRQIVVHLQIVHSSVAVRIRDV